MVSHWGPKEYPDPSLKAPGALLQVVAALARRCGIGAVFEKLLRQEKQVSSDAQARLLAGSLQFAAQKPVGTSELG